MADKTRKDVELHITGKDDSGPASRSAVRNIGNVTTALDKNAEAARRATEASAANYNRVADDLYKAQQAAVKSRKDFEAFYAQMENVAEPTRAQQREFDQLAQAADRADAKVLKLTGSLAKAEQAFNERNAAAQKANSDVGYVRQVTEAIEKAEEAQRRAASLSAFRDIGAQAAAGAQGLDAFTTKARAADTASDNLSASIRGILDPAAQARTSLSGLESEVSRVVGVVGEADKPIRDYQEAINDLGRIQADLMRQAGDIDAFKRQQEEVRLASAAYEEARQDVLRYAQAVQQADEPNEELARSLKQAEGAMEAAGRELDTQRNRLERLKRPLDQAKISTDDLAGAENRLKVAAEATSGAVTKLDKAMAGQNSRTGRFLGLRPYEIQNLGFQINDVFTQLASGASVTQTLAQQGGQILQIFPGLFSRILAFAPQLAAIVLVGGTALAAIKKVLDEEATVRQFSGQLTLMADGARYSAQELAATTGVLDRYGASLKDARTEVMEFVRQGLDPTLIERYGVAAQNLSDVIGIEVPDAAKKMTTAFTGGWEQVKALDDATDFLTAAEAEHIKAMFESGEAAKARTEAFEIFEARVDEAARKSRTEWTDSTRQLDNAWDSFLTTISNTDAIINTIAILHGLVDLADEATKALDGLGARRAADQAAGRQTPGFPEWPSWIPSPIRQTTKPGNPLPSPLGIVNQAADATDRIDALLRAAGFGPRPGAAGRTTTAPARTTPAQQGPTQRQLKDEAELTAEYRDQAEALKGLTAAEKLAAAQRRLQRAEDAARKKAQEKNLGDEQTARVVATARAVEQAKIDSEQARADAAAARKGAAAARRDAAQERAAEAKRASLEARLLQEQRSMEARIARDQDTSLVDRLTAIDLAYAKIFDTIEKYKTAGGTTIDGQTIEEYTKRVEANKELLKQQETLAFYEAKQKALVEQRTAAIERLAERQASGELTSEQVVQEAIKLQQQINPLLVANADEAIKFAEALNAIKPTPELSAFIEKMRLMRTSASATTGANTVVADAGRTQLQIRERELNAIIQERQQLVQATNELVELGVITQVEGQRRIADAYAKTTPLVEEQTKQMKALLDDLKEAGVITPVVYDAWIAKLQAVNAQATYVDSTFLQIKQTAQDSFVNGVSTFVREAGTAIGEALVGTKSWEEAVESLGRAALNFALSFLQNIADIIVQIAALRAVQNMPFFNNLTKGIMDFTGLAAGAATLQTASATMTAGSASLNAGATTLTVGSAQLSAGATTLAATAPAWLVVAQQIKEAAAALAAAAAAQAAANSAGGPAGIMHGGGTVGGVGGRSRRVSAATFAGAPRHHDGTVVGLRHDEYATILQRNEEVLKANDPRNILNGGAAAGGGGGSFGGNLMLKIINALSSSELVSEGLNTSDGEKAFLNVIGRNKSSINKLLGKTN